MNWSTADSSLAAAFAALGFVVTMRQTEIIEKNNLIKLRFFVSERSANRLALHRDLLRAHWELGTLAQQDATHPFLCALAAIHNYKALLKYQAGGPNIRLTPINAGWRYEIGQEEPTLKHSRECIRSVDLPLVAALGFVGFPVVDILGEAGSRQYILPNRGHYHLGRSADFEPEYTAQSLKRRSEKGGHHLALETSKPEHPLCLAYNGSYAYAKLTAEIKRQSRLLLIKAPDSSRRALIPENPSDALMDEVQQHFMGA